MALAASLQTLCFRLGIKSTCISKAMEFHDLLKTHAASLSALRLQGSCKLVICLDLAARNAGITPTLKDVVRMSGMARKSYTEAYRVVAAILGVEERTSLRALAVQFGCPRVVPQAANILQRYTKDQSSDVDFGSSMFLCAALFVAARQEKIKIDSSKLKERSGMKKSMFDHLVGQMQKYITSEDTNFSGKTRSSMKRKVGLMDAIDAQIQEDEQAAKIAKLKEETEDVREDKKHRKDNNYEEWKKKILEKAKQKP
ncbi:origin recognition complex subunit 6-like [Elysia marginata]|uniref:Origin recognition complex subunit 6-like n=1 Tax=Elysia marginata TaxID=1093978 RepID=A0AAV4JJZ6_9GAST|nr:origin recognition complex subunit 6-like [Elysia marginata]